ncbi:MAG: putative serine/threonine protein kinase [Streblomastix strix]|uniref:non-specific serine/threonine protein kinase n=1 Tax=Streblomastix strix TaxID=222440 RepID=A0A5J4WUF5_9EUKA|nr:MAG: putative serine/threonine protein kinase [Streblomastix strix]
MPYTVICANPPCQDKEPTNTNEDKKCRRCNAQLLLHERFYITQVLGSGSFGKTYFGVDILQKDNKGQPLSVVIKMFYSKFKSAKARSLFKLEAEQLKNLNHFSIPKYYDDFIQEGRQFIIEERVWGDDLKNIVKNKGVFTEDECIEFLSQLEPVLKYIHREGVIHRDIKPDNIIRRDVDGLYVVIDFGASYLREIESMEEDEGGSLRLPTYLGNDAFGGTVIGTPGYIAPEVMEHVRTHKCDYYSLGATSIFLVTGIEPNKIRNGIHFWQELEQAQKLSYEFKTDIQQMIEIDPSARKLSLTCVEKWRKSHAVTPKSTEFAPSDLMNSISKLINTFTKQSTPVQGAIVAAIVILLFLFIQFLKESPGLAFLIIGVVAAVAYFFVFKKKE